MSGEIPNIKNLIYLETDVGKTWKSTKKHYVWEFTIDEKHHKIEMYDSKMSGKKKVIKDGKIIFEDENTFDITFSHAFTINEHACTLIQYGENYELRLNNNSFNYLMDLEKNKLFFGNNAKKDPTSTTIINNSGKQNKNFVGNYSKQEAPKTGGGGFGFAIKPVSNPQGNFNMQKKMPEFTQLPGNSNKPKEQTVKSESKNNNNGNLLIDFGESDQGNLGQSSKTQNNNLVDLLGGIDFNQNDQTNQNNNQINNTQAIVSVDTSTKPVTNNNTLLDFNLVGSSSNQTNTNIKNICDLFNDKTNNNMMSTADMGLVKNQNIYGQYGGQIGINNNINQSQYIGSNQYAYQNQFNMGYNNQNMGVNQNMGGNQYMGPNINMGSNQYVGPNQNMGGNQNVNFNINNTNSNSVKKNVDPLDSLFG